MRNKGKVYPSPSSSSPSMSSYSANRDVLSVFKLLPVAILALVSALPLEDREVFAYMITKPMKSANPSSIGEGKKKSNRRSNTHKPPVFDCECFDCYTSYWFRWDSSPNREFIHEAIEAFEEHLASEEQLKKSSRGKKREKMSRRGSKIPANISKTLAPEREADCPEVDEYFVSVMPGNDAPPVVLPEKADRKAGNGEEEAEAEARNDLLDEEAAPLEAAVVLRSSSANNHKGLLRKVLPDVVGLFHSRLWSLWSPNA